MNTAEKHLTTFSILVILILMVVGVVALVAFSILYFGPKGGVIALVGIVLVALYLLIYNSIK